MSPRRLATVLKDLRERSELTQEELARRSKVARGYVAKLEAGHARNPSIDILKRLAKALGVSVGDLLE